MASVHFEPDQPNRTPITQREAEEIIALWARRQHQDEVTQSMPTVEELSEVLNAPPSEVASMLDEVRRTPSVPTVTTLAARPARRWPRVLAVLALLGVVCAIGYEWGVARTQYLRAQAVPILEPVPAPAALPVDSALASPPPMSTSPAPPDLAYATPDVNLSSAPKGFTVTFDGYSIPGGQKSAPADASRLMSWLQQNLTQATREMSALDVFVSRETGKVDILQLQRALRAEQNYADLLVFRDAFIEGPGFKVSAKLPLLTSPRVPEDARVLIDLETERRIKKLVSQAAAAYGKRSR